MTDEEQSVITEKMRTFLDAESLSRSYEIERGAVTRYADAIGDTNRSQSEGPRNGNTEDDQFAVPPTFLCSLFPGPYPEVFPEPYAYALSGEDEWTFLQDVFFGDRITVTSRIVDLFEKRGTVGPMLFRASEIRYVNQHRDVVATMRNTLITYGEGETVRPPITVAASEPTPQSQALEFRKVRKGDRLPPLVEDVTTTQLVKYAGASGDFSRHHFDSGFASEMGLPDVVVHGALKTALLTKFVTNWSGRSARLLELKVRFVAADYPGLLTCRGKVIGTRLEEDSGLVDLELWIEDENGQVTTSGSAICEFLATTP